MKWNTKEYDKNKIDLVYLWVDGNDPEHRKSREYWQKQLGVPESESNNEHKYVDHEELRYSLRSAMKNAPWIRKIFIVTNGQIPKWLDLSKTDKIEIINQNQIMPQDALPTFNSGAIEFCIHNIPDLTEHFLLANDDCFFNRPVLPDFFFEKDGKPIVRLQKMKISRYKIQNYIYHRTIKRSNDLIFNIPNSKSWLIPQHNIDAYSKSLYKECIETFPNEFKNVIYSKFRSEGIQRVIFSLYLLKNNKGKLKHIHRHRFYKHEDSLYIEISGLSMLGQIIKNTPYLICLNDSCRVKDKHLANYKTFLEYLFPEKQNFEKNDYISNIYPERFELYKMYEKDHGILWKVRNKIKYFFVAPLSFLLNLMVDVEKDKNKKDITILNIIKFSVKRKRKKEVT